MHVLRNYQCIFKWDIVIRPTYLNINMYFPIIVDV